MNIIMNGVYAQGGLCNFLTVTKGRKNPASRGVRGLLSSFFIAGIATKLNHSVDNESERRFYRLLACKVCLGDTTA